MGTPQIIFLVILAGALALFVSEKLRVDVTAMLTLLALVVTGLIDGKQALAGFSSEPAIIVAAVFVLSAGLTATGITDRIGAAIGRGAAGNEWRAICVIIPAVATLAAFSHHLMVTAMMLPVLMRLAREQQLSASRLLMPMSLAASLGTTLTLISAPAFLLANDLLQRNGEEGLGVFSITPIGVALVSIGLVYMLLGKRLLPRRSGTLDTAAYLQLEKYYTELMIDEESAWIGKPFGDFKQHFEGRLRVVDWLRHGSRLRRRRNERVLQAGDVLLVLAPPDELVSIRDEPGVSLHAVAKYGDVAREGAGGKDDERLGEDELVQAVVGPRSPFAGQSIGDIDFLRTQGVVVVGLWRKQGWLREEISQVRLQEGDLLVLSGRPPQFAELAAHHGVLMMVPFKATKRQLHRWPVAAGIMLASVLLAASELLPAHIAFLAGALAMVLSRCVDLEQAYGSIEVRIFVMIAGVIPLGIAMEQTGTAQLFADLLLRVVDDWSAFSVLLLMFAAAALLTQVLSDAATTALLAPVAIAVAQSLGLSPVPFVVCTALGAVASFLTPIGHHGNLLILNPGQYTFGDFLRVGIGLTLSIALTSAWMARWLWLDGALLPGL